MNTGQAVSAQKVTSDIGDEKTGAAKNQQTDLTKLLERTTKRRGLIGIITNTFESPYYGRMVERASNFLLVRGYHSIVQSNAKSKTGELDAWMSLEACECDGLIIHSNSLTDEELVQLLELYPKSVLMNRYLPQYEERCVYLDNIYGGQLAGSHLVEMGHKNIAMVTGPNSFFEVKERTAGFIEALSSHTPGLEPKLVIEGDFMLEGGANAIRTIVDSEQQITAVFFHNDDMAFGALEQCRLTGINVPNDLSIIGYDDLLPCRHTSPTLTSIHQPLKRIGEAAAMLIHEMLSDEEWPRIKGETNRTLFKPVLAERESVKKLGVPHFNSLISKREVECLEWTAIGKTSWEISVILGISESTVTFHLRNATAKLNASNRTHAVSISLKTGLITAQFDKINMPDG